MVVLHSYLVTSDADTILDTLYFWAVNVGQCVTAVAVTSVCMSVISFSACVFLWKRACVLDGGGMCVCEWVCASMCVCVCI